MSERQRWRQRRQGLLLAQGERTQLAAMPIPSKARQGGAGRLSAAALQTPAGPRAPGTPELPA